MCIRDRYKVIMKKRIVQLQIGAAAIAAILGTGSGINAFPCSAALVTAYAKEQNTEENVTVVNAKTTWKYLDNNTDPASGLSSLTAWTTPDFNDSAWKSAAGKFGAKRVSFSCQRFSDAFQFFRFYVSVKEQFFCFFFCQLV